jgi:hypothetical protein
VDWLSLPWQPPAPQVHVVIDHGIRAARQIAGFNWPAWIEAGAAFIAAVAASIALWYNAFPLCDLYELKCCEINGNLKLKCGVKNVRNGYSSEVKIWLLEYGEISEFPNPDHYIAPMGPHEKLDPKFESEEIKLDGQKTTGYKFRVLLKWKALFGTVGETYVEEHFGKDKTNRTRTRAVYFPERIWRTIWRYDWKGRDEFISPWGRVRRTPVWCIVRIKNLVPKRAQKV